MFAANVFEGVAYLMDNAELDTCIGEYALYDVGEVFQAVNTAYQYIPDASVLEIAQNLQPEVRSFTLGDVHAKKFLVPLLVDAQYIVDGTRHGTSGLVFHLIMDGIQPAYCVYRLKHPGTPCLNFRQYPVCDGTDGFCR